MHRLHHLLRPLALLAFATGCAGVRPQGALSPMGARVTNEVIADDAQTFGEWARRIAVLRQAGGAGTGPHAYAAARAAAWLAYARDSYTWDPRDRAADLALDETRRIVVALEAGTPPDLRALPVLTEMQARPDLWSALDRARAGSAMREAPAALADAEVALVRASRLAGTVPAGSTALRPMTDVERACELQLQVATAERLIAGMELAAAPLTVALQGAPPAAARVRVAQPTALAAPAGAPSPAVATAPARRGMQRLVHFARGSSELSVASRVTLGEVIALLRSHPRVQLVIHGYTDVRGDEVHNNELSWRRALAVRRFLDGAKLHIGRVTLEGFGTDSLARRSVSTRDYARDRRVALSFTSATGEPLTVAAYHSLAVDNERDLQVEQGRRRRTRAARHTSGGALRPSATPR